MNHIIVCLSSLKSFLKLLVISNSGELLGMDYEKKNKKHLPHELSAIFPVFFPCTLHKIRGCETLNSRQYD